MDWFQHNTTSIDDPDILEAEDLFGDAGYSVFFKLLEIYGAEFNHLVGGNLTISVRVLQRKLRKRWGKVEKILNFYQLKRRIFFTLDENYLIFKVPKFIEKASNWTKRTHKEEEPPPTEVPTEAPHAKEENRKEKNKYSQNSDEFRLAEYLFKHIKKRSPNFKKPNLQVWAKSINALIRIDKRPAKEIRGVIKWCQNDSFWQNNILSPMKLRVQYDQLLLKSGKQQKERQRSALPETPTRCSKCNRPVKEIGPLDTDGICRGCSGAKRRDVQQLVEGIGL